MARPKGHRKEARLSVSFDSADYAQLNALAARRAVSVAWLIRSAVQELITRERNALENPELPLVRRQHRAEGVRHE
jgi:predicted DNA-binding ribbon-helix-helix protein